MFHEVARGVASPPRSFAEILCNQPSFAATCAQSMRRNRCRMNYASRVRTSGLFAQPIPFFSPESALPRGNGEQETLLKGRNFSSLVPFVSRYSTDEFCIYIYIYRCVVSFCSDSSSLYFRICLFFFYMRGIEIFS